MVISLRKRKILKKEKERGFVDFKRKEILHLEMKNNTEINTQQMCIIAY